MDNKDIFQILLDAFTLLLAVLLALAIPVLFVLVVGGVL